MKLFQLLIAVCGAGILNAQITTLKPGAAAPAIALQNVDGKTVSFADYPEAKGFVVVFTCNTCPYSKAYASRLVGLHQKYAPLGFPVLAVNPNDPQASPGDSFTQMKVYARAHHFSFPYLYDPGQRVTAAYGARNTPQVFVVVKAATGNTIAYTGAIDNDTPDTDPAKIRYVENALDALIANKQPELTVTKAIGCAVRWKEENQR